MTLEADILAAFPAEVRIPAGLVADAVAASSAETPRMLVVLDDDPTEYGVELVDAPLFGIHIVAAAEAMALADALGLDQAKTLAALEAGAAGSFMLSNRGPPILEAYTEEGAEVLSNLDIFVKDMGIVGKATRAAGLAAPVAAAAEQLYLLGQAQGLAAADDSAVIKVVAPTKCTA